LYQLSDTQLKQTIVARALATSPNYLIADVLTSKSNGQVKRTLFELLLKIKKRLGIGLLLIDNDVANLCNYTDRIGIMLYGRLVEIASTDEILNSPMHPYTKRIIELSNQRTTLNDFQLDEDKANTAAPAGCPYAGKCNKAESKCRLVIPEFQLKFNGRCVACHYIDEESSTVGHVDTKLGMAI